METIILTGGGTAGHIMPNIALAEELAKHFEHIIYMGGEGMEREIAASNNLPFYSTACVKLYRKNILANAKIPFVLLRGVTQAKRIFDSLKPNAVFSKGGYAALPACFAAYLKKVPLIVHESDYSLGVANKVAARFAKRVLTSFEETEGGEYTGNPIKSNIDKGDKQVIISRYKLDRKPVILIMGGSGGAEAINRIVYQALPTLIKSFNVIHLTGKSGDKSVNYPGYYQEEFAYDIQHYYAAADLVVSRGGANSLAEIAANGKRNIAIPLPKGNSRGDQEQNAKSWHKRGQIEILTQQNLTCASLLSAIETTFERPAPPKADNHTVIERIVSVILSEAKPYKK
ncbi:MAG: UDP-N-acetylglucosamine--N-acetylmuramyl-(pentapeptide) pyrophosphoryl-undecaprenol N-acetylglucosamine transferase [Christensenellales bacterium]|jgi:UDP-N-acetylglucosamine--N-acetylmuramyl-(pentapeptide) pyrophosphoryl-undecaprenol N-acetylglucosamine transferase